MKSPNRVKTIEVIKFNASVEFDYWCPNRCMPAFVSSNHYLTGSANYITRPCPPVVKHYVQVMRVRGV
jgi:hypothetical protein